MTMQEKLQVMARGSIALDIGGAAAYRRGGTRFGGQPDVPPGFVWPSRCSGRSHWPRSLPVLSWILRCWLD